MQGISKEVSFSNNFSNKKPKYQKSKKFIQDF